MKCAGLSNRLGFALALALVGSLGCSGGNTGGDTDPDPLKVALLPDESPSTIIKDNEGLKSYLEKELGRKVELMVTTDYSSMIEATRHGRIHVAYFGPLSYCLAKQRCNIEPFAAKRSGGSTTYTAVVVVNADRGIKTLKDLRGKKMAYGDKASTSSHLIPKSMLAAAGLKAGEDYEEFFAGAHDAVALNVQRGNADAGGLSRPIFDSMVERKLIDPAKVKVLAESKPFPQYPWVMQGNLKPELKKKIKEAFYGLKDKAILKPLKADGFAPIADKDYDVVRELARVLDLDLTKQQ
jgi:phosphonate transport system substrate-binding protein